MKKPKPVLLLQLLLLQISLSAQVQWYQSQDGNNPPPNGTVGTSVQSLTSHSFLACYQWRINNDQFTWKISKSHTNGTEQRTFFITGTTAQVEVKTGHRNAVYVFERNFPLGQNAEYTIYKLDTNLNIRSQRNIDFPNSFNIFNMNAFELDQDDNLYFAGDGQYPNGPGFSPASFVMKTDKNLVTRWSRMDSTQTCYSRLNIDRLGYVWMIADFYTFFPDIYISKIAPNGQLVRTTTLHTDAGRYNLLSTFDNNDNLLIYGGKFVGDTAQAVFLYKISRLTGRAQYSKTYFTSIATQLYDWKVDHHGDIFSLVSQYSGPGNQLCKISSINSENGNIRWNKSFKYAQDSCNLFKLVMNEGERFYAVGEKRYHDILSRGFALRMKKNGQSEGNYIAPDSVAFQRSHWLSDGITDGNDQLISIGNTDDLDTITYQSSYFRSFAVKFGGNKNDNHNCNNDNAMAPVNPAEETTLSKLVVYPNPVQNQLAVVNLTPNEYDRLAVYSIQGALVLQSSISGTSAKMDVTALKNGVYLVVLRSSLTQKEKSATFVLSH